MILKCTNISKAVKSVLSWILRISVFRGQFLYLLVLWHDFSFDIIFKYLDLSGNIKYVPLKPSYGV